MYLVLHYRGEVKGQCHKQDPELLLERLTNLPSLGDYRLCLNVVSLRTLFFRVCSYWSVSLSQFSSVLERLLGLCCYICVIPVQARSADEILFSYITVILVRLGICVLCHI